MWRKGIRVFAAFFSVSILFPGIGAAQTYAVRRISPASTKGYDAVHVSKAATAGEKVRIWWATSLNPDCTAQGEMSAQIVAPPRHGQVTMSDEQFYPNYIAPNPRVVCDARRVPGKQAFYVADAGFHGHDKVVLQNATSEGRIRRIIVDIDVR